MKSVTGTITIGVALLFAGLGDAALAQELKRVEVKAAITSSEVAGIAVGKTLHLTARPGEAAKFAFPTLVKVKAEPVTIVLDPAAQGQFTVSGNVKDSSISGIKDGDRIECKIGLTKVTCTRQRATDIAPFVGNVRDLVVVREPEN